MKRLHVVFLLLSVVGLLVAAPVAWAHETAVEQESDLVLIPTSVDGGFAVSLDVAGMALVLTFEIDEQGKPLILGLSGLPEGAVAEVDGDDVKIVLADGTEVEVGLDDVTVDDQGMPTAVKAEVEVEGPEATDEPEAEESPDADDGVEEPDEPDDLDDETDEPDDLDDDSTEEDSGDEQESDD